MLVCVTAKKTPSLNKNVSKVSKGRFFKAEKATTV